MSTSRACPLPRRAPSCASSATCPTTSRRRSCSTFSRRAASSPTSTSCCRRKSSRESPRDPRPRTTAGSPSCCSGATRSRSCSTCAPESFEPPPRVDSAVLRMTPLADARRRRSGAAARARHGRLLAAPQAPAPHRRQLADRARRRPTVRPAAARRGSPGRRMDRPRRRAKKNDPGGVGPSLSEGGERSGEGAALKECRRSAQVEAAKQPPPRRCRTRCSSAACSRRNCCSPPSWRPSPACRRR